MPVVGPAVGARFNAAPVRRIYKGASIIEPGRTNFHTNPGMETTSAPVTTRTNLVKNPSFEVNTLGTYALPGTSGAVTISNPAVGGFSGPAYALSTWTAASTAASGGIQIGNRLATGVERIDILASTQYTASVYVLTSKAKTLQFVAVQADNAGTQVGSATSSPLAVVAGAWTRLTVTFTSVATAARLYTFVQDTDVNRWLIGDTLGVDAVLVEQAPTPGTYFDGSTAASGDFSYGWTSTANASTSTQRAPGIAATSSPAGNTVTQATDQQHSGTNSARAICLGTVAGEGIIFAIGGATHSNAKVTCGLWVKGSAGVPLFMLVRLASAAVPDVRLDFTCTGAWQWVSLTHVADAAGTTIQIHLRTKNAQTTIFYADDLIVDDAATVPDYKDGSFAGWSWDGAINASISRGIH